MIKRHRNRPQRGIETTERLVRDADLDLILLAGRYTLLEQGPLATLYFRFVRSAGVGVSSQRGSLIRGCWQADQHLQLRGRAR